MQMASHYPMNIHHRSNFGMYGYPPIGYPAASWPPQNALSYHPSRNVHMNLPGASPYPHFDASRHNHDHRRMHGFPMNDGRVPQNVAAQPRGPLQGANGMISLMHRPQIRQGGRSGGLLQNMGALRLPLALIRAAGGGGSGGGGGFLEAIHNFQESVGGVGRMFGGAQELFAGGLGDFFSGGVGDLLDGGLGDIIGGFMDI